MTDPIRPIPDGFHTLTPHLVVKGAAAAIGFYKKAFGAEERGCHMGPDGTSVMHATLQIGDSMIMLNDEFPEWDCKGPEEGASAVTVHLYVDDVDSVFDRAITAGATSTMPVQNTFWGDRYGKIVDPFGHHWSIATRVEEVSQDEVAERMKKQFGG